MVGAMGRAPEPRAAYELPGPVVAGAGVALFVGSAAASTAKALSTAGPGSGQVLLASSGYGMTAALAVLAAGLLLFAHAAFERSHPRRRQSASFWHSSAFAAWVARAVAACAVVAIAVNGVAAAVQIDVSRGWLPSRVGLAVSSFLASAPVFLLGAAAAIGGGRAQARGAPSDSTSASEGGG